MDSDGKFLALARERGIDEDCDGIVIRGHLAIFELRTHYGIESVYWNYSREGGRPSQGLSYRNIGSSLPIGQMLEIYL